MTSSSGIGQVPATPTYAEIKQVVHALEGEPAKRVLDMMHAMRELVALRSSKRTRSQ
jgi:hypothetical protein